MRALTLAAGLVALALLAPAMAAAHHSAPATYTGSVAGGGTVEFDVSGDGASITRFAIADVDTECGTFTTTFTGSAPITNHAFDQPNDPLRFSGSFPADQQAQGSLRLHSFFPSCTTSEIAWTASTTAAPPSACADGADNDGDGKVDLADPGCSDAGDGDETDPAQTPPPPTDQQPPPSSEPPPGSAPTAPVAAPTMRVRRVQALTGLRRRGVSAVVTCGEPCSVTAVLLLDRRAARRLGIAARSTVIGRGRGELAQAGSARVAVRLTARAKRRLRGVKRLRLALRMRVVPESGTATTLTRRIVAR